MSEFFQGIEAIQYEGPDSKNMLAFRHYDANAVVEGKTMRDHFRFAVSKGANPLKNTQSKAMKRIRSRLF